MLSQSTVTQSVCSNVLKSTKKVPLCLQLLQPVYLRIKNKIDDLFSGTFLVHNPIHSKKEHGLWRCYVFPSKKKIKFINGIRNKHKVHFGLLGSFSWFLQSEGICAQWTVKKNWKRQLKDQGWKAMKTVFEQTVARCGLLSFDHLKIDRQNWLHQSSQWWRNRSVYDTFHLFGSMSQKCNQETVSSQTSSFSFSTPQLTVAPRKSVTYDSRHCVVTLCTSILFQFSDYFRCKAGETVREKWNNV